MLLDHSSEENGNGNTLQNALLATSWGELKRGKLVSLSRKQKISTRFEHTNIVK